jgi:hypothetical protein
VYIEPAWQRQASVCVEESETALGTDKDIKLGD